MSLCHVLIVDDSPVMRQMMRMSLRRLRHLCITEAENGAQALGRILAQRFDLIVTDLNMPGIDGVKLIHKIKSDPANRQAAIVVVSSIDSPQQQDKLRKMGVDTYLVKPVSGDEVFDAVVQLLEMVPPATVAD